MSIIQIKTLDNFTDEISGLFPQNTLLFKNGAINNETKPIFRKFIKYLLAKPLLEISSVFNDLLDALLLKNTLLIDLFEQEVGLPDSLFQDQSTPDIRLANIRLKLGMKKLFACGDSTDGRKGITTYIQEATGMILECKGIKEQYASFAPMFAPLWAIGEYDTIKFQSYWKVINANGYSLDFIEKLLLKIAPVYEGIIIIS